MYTSKKFGSMLLFSVVIGILIVEGTSWGIGLLPEPFGEPEKTSGGETAPSVPIHVKLSLSNAPALGQSAKLTCTVTSILDAPNTKIEITLPEGFSLMSGELSWKGNISENGKVEINAVIKSVRVGNWTVEATAGYPFAGDSWYGDVHRLYIHVSEDSATYSEEPFPSEGSESIKLP